MEEASPRLEDIFRAASRRLMLKASLSAITLPIVVLALFSLTIFRFTSRQYLIFLLAIAAVVIPLAVLLGLFYFAMQRRQLRRLMAWYGRVRDPRSQDDRDLTLRLQQDLSSSSFKHGALVALGIFLSLALSVIFFGGLAGFTLYTSVCYITMGFLMALTDFFITVFISQREMRKVLEKFLADCKAFGYHASVGIGVRLAAFALAILVLTIGITWIASSYQSYDLLKQETRKRGADNVSLLAGRLDVLIDEEATTGELEEAARNLSLSDNERLAIYNPRGTAVYEIRLGEVADSAWNELLQERAGEDDHATVSRFEQLGSKEYLLTGAPLAINEGWTVARVDIPEIAFHALGRMSPTMLLLLLVGAGVSAFLTLLLSHNITDPIKRLVRICRVVGTGDLAVDVPVDSLDDVGELSSSYSEMLGSLRQISRNLLETSGEVSEGAENIVAVSEEFMAAIEELNALVQDLSGQIEHEVEQIRNVEDVMGSVAETISMSHAKASQSYEISQDAEKLVIEGREHAREAVEKIGDFKDMLDESMEAIISLGESSLKISTIVDIITRIAEQTNLLALNAAIEAARVPEHGKGFAVVADEVKKLAQEAAGSAQRINDLVRVIQKDVETAKNIMEKGTIGMYVGIETVDRTDHSLVSISGVVDQMARLAGAIADASSQEMDESERLAESLEQMKNQVESDAQSYEEIGASSEQQTAATMELANTAARLSDIAHKLYDMVAHFKTS